LNNYNSESESPDRRLEYALLVLLAALWGSSYLALKVAVRELPPITTIAARVGIAAVILVAILYARGDRLPADKRTWRNLFVQSFFSATASWPLLAWGAQRIDSSLAGVLNSTSPIWVFFITLFITRHEKLSWLKFAGAAGGILGVATVIGWSPAGSAGADTPGQVAAVASAMLYACAAVWGTRYSGASVTAVAAGTMVWSSACLLPLSLLLEQPWLLRPSTQALLATLYLGVVTTAATMMLYFRLVKTLGSLGVASQAYLRAGWSVLLGALVLGEAITIQVAIGLAAIVIAVSAINSGRK
jgi:drug/metabolite transporter (DMT)-like permease